MKESAPFKIGSALVKGIANAPLIPFNAYQKYKTRRDRGGINRNKFDQSYAEIIEYPEQNMTIKSYPYAPHFDLGMKGLKKITPHKLVVDQTIDLRQKPEKVPEPEYDVLASGGDYSSPIYKKGLKPGITQKAESRPEYEY
tara:strand:+ start:596 stop:1018 length:423 start_codon:yes stop_codon:yes gene_type:complete